MGLRFEVAAGAHLDWLPQETILFDRANLSWHTVIWLHPQALGCLALESVILGRAAMGEVVRQIVFRDRREIWRGERLIFADPTGTAVRFEPGQSREVRLAPLAGLRRVYGFNAKVMGDL